LSFGIHNHWWEFDPVDGTSLIRLFHEMLDPEIFWQLDVYWAQTAGADPARIIRELGPRIRSIHWKDGPAVHGQPMTALGEGKVDIPRMISAISHPVDSIIELDECATDPLDAARRGRIYLEAVH
jgi:sugar phosphate isomerase/epimerase